MATFVLTDAMILAGGYDLSGLSNQLGVGWSVDEVDITTFGNSGKRRLAGLQDIDASFDGYSDFDESNPGSDLALITQLGVVGVFTFGATKTAGDRAFTMQGVETSYEWGGAVGSAAPFSGEAMGSGILVPGTLMEDPDTALTATGNGTARQLGAVASGESLYAALHVFAASGTSPSLTVAVESDDNSGMTTPTTQGTFAAKTAVGDEWLTPVAGAITDDWWRVTWTISGTSPSFSAVMVLGIT